MFHPIMGGKPMGTLIDCNNTDCLAFAIFLPLNRWTPGTSLSVQECQPCPCLPGGFFKAKATQAALRTSQRRSLVKISSLASSSWFHSKSSLSCPFQLSLSCSFVLKATSAERSWWLINIKTTLWFVSGSHLSLGVG